MPCGFRALARNACAVALGGLLGLARPAAGGAFEFALIGDVPYSDEATTNAFPNLIQELNKARLAFVIHDGDIKSGSSPCSDEILEARYRQLQSIRHPLFYVPGDNEWLDCGENRTNRFNAAERLEKLRQLFTQGDRSMGQATLRLTRQSERPEFAPFRENIRWSHGKVLFAGFNMPGTANNHGTAEFAPRHAANMAWLKEAFEVARRGKHRAIMLVIQANPHFELDPTNSVRAGFNEFLTELEAETVRFKKPVVLVHGDSHYFRIDKPILGSRSRRRLENFTRVETFGNPDVHWIRVRVEPRHRDVFRFYPELVEKNLLDHSRAP